MKFSPYSFSKISSFQQCPQRFKYDYIEKLGIFQKSQALEKGSYIHLWLENIGKEIFEKPNYNFNFSSPDDVGEYDRILKNFIKSKIGRFYLKKQILGVEIPFGVKKNGNELTTSNYYDKESIFRGKIDHSFIDQGVLYLVDWKTGKINPWQNFLQLEMYAVWGFLKFPEIETINASFVYVEHNSRKKVKYKRKDLLKLIKKVVSEIRNIEKENDFPKKESALCDYCSYRKEGICKESTQNDFLKSIEKYNPQF